MYRAYYGEKTAETVRIRKEEEKFAKVMERNVTSRAALAELGAMRSLYGLHSRRDQKRA